MTLSEARRLALSLPETNEEPHFQSSSFRVRGKIFATIPPPGEFLHVFVSEEQRELALALDPGFLDKLLWGGRVAGLRVRLAAADPGVVGRLLLQSWQRKAPKSLARARAAAANPSSAGE